MNSPTKIWRDSKKIKDLLGMKGEILTWTKIYAPPQGFEDYTPYFVAIVKLENGVKIPLQIVDLESDGQIDYGKRIVTIVRRLGKVGKNEVIEYGLKGKII